MSSVDSVCAVGGSMQRCPAVLSPCSHVCAFSHKLIHELKVTVL